MTEQTVTLPLGTLETPAVGIVDVWLMDLSELPALGPAQVQSDELPSGFSPQQWQQRFFTRLLLGAYLDRPGKSVRWSKTPEGKPYLEGDPLAINWSHTGHWLAVAVSSHHTIGIDIERDRTMPRAQALSKRYFSEPEACYLDELDEPIRSRVFLQAWTHREALVKAQGVGLASALSELALSTDHQELLRCPGAWPEVSQWSLVALDASMPLIGSVASTSPIEAVCLRRLAPARD